MVVGGPVLDDGAHVLDGVAELTGMLLAGLELGTELVFGLDDVLGADASVDEMIWDELDGALFDEVAVLLALLALEELALTTPESGGFKLYP